MKSIVVKVCKLPRAKFHFNLIAQHSDYGFYLKIYGEVEAMTQI